jgi:AmiR/NasT family two-component response regulator
VDPAIKTLGLVGGVGLYTLDSAQLKPMRSILDAIQAKSRRIDDVSHRLESAGMTLTERKVIERAHLSPLGWEHMNLRGDYQ